MTGRFIVVSLTLVHRNTTDFEIKLEKRLTGTNLYAMLSDEQYASWEKE